ncbi:hypothetical protein [Nocardia flavorosea]|uniref:hypothetical protein n=1 Tax=Nocardia flavorosea TaxID=53429 RepID=UPI001E2CF369|nr:hypothetical protein [Nocardia flavorosea]
MNGTEDIGQESAEVSEWASVPPTEEQLDEDELAADPLEEGMDPPDDWSAADRYATTPREQREGESLDERLAEEQPDIVPDGEQSGAAPDRGRRRE